LKKFLLIIVVGVFLSALGFRLYQELGGGRGGGGGADRPAVGAPRVVADPLEAADPPCW